MISYDDDDDDDDYDDDDTDDDNVLRIKPGEKDLVDGAPIELGHPDQWMALKHDIVLTPHIRKWDYIAKLNVRIITQCISIISDQI